MHANGILSSFVSSLEWRRDWLHGPHQLLSDTFSPLTTQCQWTSHLFIFSFFFFLLGRTAKKQTQTQKIFLWWTFHWTSFSATIHDPPTWLGLSERMSQWGPEIDFCVKGVERGGAVRGADLCGHFFPHHRSPLAIFFFFLFLSHLTTTKSPPLPLKQWLQEGKNQESAQKNTTFCNTGAVKKPCQSKKVHERILLCF